MAKTVKPRMVVVITLANGATWYAGKNDTVVPWPSQARKFAHPSMADTARNVSRLPATILAKSLNTEIASIEIVPA